MLKDRYVKLILLVLASIILTFAWFNLTEPIYQVFIVFTFGIVILLFLLGYKKDKKERFYHREIYLFTKDVKSQDIHFSENVLEKYNIPIDKVTMDTIKPYIHEADYHTFINKVIDAKQGKISECEFRTVLKTSEIKWFSLTMTPILNKMKKVERINGIIIDITKDKVENERVEKCQTILNRAVVGIFLINNKKLTYVNSYIEEMVKYTKDELYERSIKSIINSKDHEKLEKEITDLLMRKKDSFIDELNIIKKDNTEAIAFVNCTITSYNDEDTLIGTLVDITDRKEIEDKIRYKAYHDELTGLSNRYAINMLIDQEIDTNKDSKFAVLFIDLDRFKMINDSLGHSIGDELLKLVAKRLVPCVDEKDVVSRYGGDEFVILLRETNELEIKKVCEKIIHEFSYPLKIKARDIYVLPSIGISIYPTDSDNRENLIQYADNAMYYVKDNGRNNYKFYDSQLNAIVSKNFELESDLRNALMNGEFELYYQPLYDLKTNKIICFEALIRWHHPNKGMINPIDFITLAEEIGLIIPIGNWVIEAACKQIKKWNELGYLVKIAVNISYSHFTHESFLSYLRNMIEVYQIDPSSLEIEVTETVMQYRAKTTVILDELTKMGIKTSVDDFGTGYSSLSVLKSQTLRNIKIDREFIKDIQVNKNSKAIVKSIISLGENLQFDIVAEGIETKQQLDFLLENNCVYGQGFLFNKPLPANEIIHLLDNN